jgi:hypothetical protein
MTHTVDMTGDKGKVVLVLFLNWAPRHEGVLKEWRYSCTHSLTSALDGGKWLASRPGRFTSREIAPGAHWIGGWVGPRAVIDAVVKRKIPSLRRESNPRTPIVQPVAQLAMTELSRLTVTGGVQEIALRYMYAICCALWQSWWTSTQGTCAARLYFRT